MDGIIALAQLNLQTAILKIISACVSCL